MKDFDKEFNKTVRRVWILAAINSLIGLGVLGVIVYVAVHFIKKLW